jgi:prephenate dehydrogenase
VTVLVVGAGLIGTSIGLALRDAGTNVLLDDADPARTALAAELGAGRPLTRGDRADHAVIAVPPSAVAAVVKRVQEHRLAATQSDVASVKRATLDAVAAAGCDLAAFVGGHPVAGRERPGPAAARPDLFAGRAWILTPTAATSERAVRAAREVAAACGARPVEMAPDAHDAAMALVSHTPQLVASALASLLADAEPAAVALAGQGLRDTTRVAASDPALWTDIALANAAAVAPLLDRLARTLHDAARSLSIADGAGVRALLEQGAAGRARLPGKHSRAAAAFAAVAVVVPDEPGQLARLLADAAAAGVNVEDITLEHAPTAPYGVVELAVVPPAEAPLTAYLRQAGWSVHARA